jgi:hypothetical protein
MAVRRSRRSIWLEAVLMEMPMRLDRPVIRTGIVAFWAVWFLIVTATNACDVLKATQILPQDWSFASGNYQFMQTVTSRYHLPESVMRFLFVGVVCWEGLACIMFWRAAFLVGTNSIAGEQSMRTAFAIGLGLWAAFVIADEIFIAYSVEGTHVQLFIAQLLSLFYVDRMQAGLTTDAPGV